jgi:hypothetical protein
MIEIGVFQPSANGQARDQCADPLQTIAHQKGVTPESLKAFGAEVISPTTIKLPAYGPDGKRCSTFTMSNRGGKGLFAKGKRAGLFFPHVDGRVRLPKPGEVWHIVEGPKDACALNDLGLLACGLNTCRLAAKFARLFRGVHIILIPDRDQAGEDGAQHSARVLRKIAASVRLATLPAEFKESDGDDVRDVLRRPDGKQQVLQAIEDAKPPEDWEEQETPPEPKSAVAEIPILEGKSIKLEVWPAAGKPQRLVVASLGEVEYRDRVGTDSNIARERFINKLSAKLGIERDTLFSVIEPRLTKLAKEADEGAPKEEKTREENPKSKTDIAVDITSDWELWHTPSREAYATVEIDGHRENWLIRSRMLKRFISKKFFDEGGTAMNQETLTSTANLLEARALFEGPEHAVYVRLAEHEGNIYLDLCNDTWQAIEISPQGWRVMDDPPIRFRRAQGMLPLPALERGGSVDLLRPFLNVEELYWRLVIAWLIAALRPRGPYPILALFAEQGSGKSTTGRFLRELIDPNSAPLRAEPMSARDLMIAANNSWCLAYDNLSHLKPWLSDAVCRLSTGGGFTTRELYTDQDEIIFESQRPVLLTSIEEVATRSDLLDRCLIIWLRAIPEDRRRPEAELWQEFERVRPRILGALLDAVAGALRSLPSTKPPALPRMADFALWVTAAEAGLGWPSGSFMAAYQSNRESADQLAIEASVLAKPLVDFLEQTRRWTGSSGELLAALDGRESEQTRRLHDWPKSPRALSGQLKRLAPNLRKLGWQVERDRNSKKRLWIMGPIDDGRDSTPSSEPSQDARGKTMQSDANWYHPEGNDANDGDDGSAEERWNPDRY